MKQLFIDTETSGLNDYKHGIWQIACRLYIDGEFEIGWETNCNIFPDQEWHPVAKDMCSLENLDEHVSAEQAFRLFKSFLKEFVDPYDTTDKMFFYAYNAKFDERFLRKFFSNNGDKYFGSWFWTPTIDIMSLAAEYLKEEIPKMENFKQGTVARELGIEVNFDLLHDAMYDIEIAKKIYDKITKG